MVGMSVVGVNKFVAMNSNLPTMAILKSKVFYKSKNNVTTSGSRSDVWGSVQSGPMHYGSHKDLPAAVDRQNDRHTSLKTLPTCSFLGGL